MQKIVIAILFLISGVGYGADHSSRDALTAILNTMDDSELERSINLANERLQYGNSDGSQSRVIANYLLSVVKQECGFQDFPVDTNSVRTCLRVENKQSAVFWDNHAVLVEYKSTGIPPRKQIYYTYYKWTSASKVLLGAAVLTGAFVVYRNRENIKRGFNWVRSKLAGTSEKQLCS